MFDGRGSGGPKPSLWKKRAAEQFGSFFGKRSGSVPLPARPTDAAQSSATEVEPQPPPSPSTEQQPPVEDYHRRHPSSKVSRRRARRGLSSTATSHTQGSSRGGSTTTTNCPRCSRMHRSSASCEYVAVAFGTPRGSPRCPLNPGRRCRTAVTKICTRHWWLSRCWTGPSKRPTHSRLLPAPPKHHRSPQLASRRLLRRPRRRNLGGFGNAAVQPTLTPLERNIKFAREFVEQLVQRRTNGITSRG